MTETTKQQLPEGTHLAYTVFHESWYAEVPGTVREPSIGIAASAEGAGGGVAWEFAVEEASFTDKSGQHPISVRLFDDAFVAIAQIPEFFAALATGSVTSLRAVCDLLDGMGAVDETKREDPYR
jgi:hypothetical protein